MGGAYVGEETGHKLFHLNPSILVLLRNEDYFYSRRPVKFYNFFFGSNLFLKLKYINKKIRMLMTCV
jgi:hypothetical protein